MHGLAPLCHEVRKDGNNGSRWPTHRRASPLLDPELHEIREASRMAESLVVWSHLGYHFCSQENVSENAKAWLLCESTAPDRTKYRRMT